MIVIQSRWPSIVGHKSVRRRCCRPPSLALIVSAGAPQLRTRPLFARAFRPAGLLAYFTPTQWDDGCQAEHMTSALGHSRRLGVGRESACLPIPDIDLPLADSQRPAVGAI